MICPETSPEANSISAAIQINCPVFLDYSNHKETGRGKESKIREKRLACASVVRTKAKNSPALTGIATGYAQMAQFCFE
jgi:hypothetical protein